MEEDLAPFVRGHAIAEGAPDVDGPFLGAAQGAEKRHGDAGAGAPVEARPGPDFAPGAAGDEVLKGSGEVITVGEGPVDVGVAEHRPADGQARRPGGEITEEQAPLLVRSLLAAGLDTTIYGLGNALYCLATNPDQTFFRTTTRPVDIDGTVIPDGAKVLMIIGSANRDPRRWGNDADRYDIGRRTPGHLAFGAGIHVCVGQFFPAWKASSSWPPWPAGRVGSR